MFFNKKKEEIFAPVTGTLMPIEAVNDPVFASKAMGTGFGIEPSAAEIYSPIIGKVVSVFPTKHAVLLKTKKGQSTLVHIGINTVELNGQGIEVHVTEGQPVDQTTKLATADFPAIAKQGKQTTVIVAFEGVSQLKLTDNNQVTANQNLGTF